MTGSDGPQTQRPRLGGRQPQLRPRDPDQPGLLYDSGRHDPIPAGLLAVDFIVGMALCLTLWFRRRWPVQLALLAAAISTFSDAAGAADPHDHHDGGDLPAVPDDARVFRVNTVSLAIYLEVRNKPEPILTSAFRRS